MTSILLRLGGARSLLGIEDKMQYSPCPLEIRQKHRRAVATGPDFGPNHMYSTVSSDWKANSLLRHFHAKKERWANSARQIRWQHTSNCHNARAAQKDMGSTETGRPNVYNLSMIPHCQRPNKANRLNFWNPASDSLCIFKHIPKHILYIEQWMVQTLPTYTTKSLQFMAKAHQSMQNGNKFDSLRAMSPQHLLTPKPISHSWYWLWLLKL